MENSEVVQLYLDDIIPNRFQPRLTFDEEGLKELSVMGRNEIVKNKLGIYIIID